MCSVGKWVQQVHLRTCAPEHKFGFAESSKVQGVRHHLLLRTEQLRSMAVMENTRRQQDAWVIASVSPGVRQMRQNHIALWYNMIVCLKLVVERDLRPGPEDPSLSLQPLTALSVSSLWTSAVADSALLCSPQPLTSAVVVSALLCPAPHLCSNLSLLSSALPLSSYTLGQGPQVQAETGSKEKEEGSGEKRKGGNVFFCAQIPFSKAAATLSVSALIP